MSEDILLSALNASEPIRKKKTIKDTKRIFRKKRPLLFKPIKTFKENSNTNKILESIGKLFRLEKKKDINDKVLGDIKNLFRLGKIKGIHDKVLRDIKTLYESVETIMNQ